MHLLVYCRWWLMLPLGILCDCTKTCCYSNSTLVTILFLLKPYNSKGLFSPTGSCNWTPGSLCNLLARQTRPSELCPRSLTLWILQQTFIASTNSHAHSSPHSKTACRPAAGLRLIFLQEVSISSCKAGFRLLLSKYRIPCSQTQCRTLHLSHEGDKWYDTVAEL